MGQQQVPIGNLVSNRMQMLGENMTSLACGRRHEERGTRNSFDRGVIHIGCTWLAQSDRCCFFSWWKERMIAEETHHPQIRPHSPQIFHCGSSSQLCVTLLSLSPYRYQK